MESLGQSLDAAVGRTQPIGLRIEHAQVGLLADGLLDQPTAIIGSHPDCDIVLTDEDVPERAACLQVVAGQILIVTFPRLGWHWLTADAPWSIAGFTLRLTAPAAEQRDSLLLHTNPLRPPVASGPEWSLRFFNGPNHDTIWPINRHFTFIGTSAACPIHVPHTDPMGSLSAFFLLTATSLWLIDVSGEASITLEGNKARVVQLAHGEIVEVSGLQMQCLLQTQATAENVQEEVIPLAAVPESVEPKVESVLPASPETSQPVQPTQAEDPAIALVAVAPESSPTANPPEPVVATDSPPVAAFPLAPAKEQLASEAATDWVFNRIAAAIPGRKSMWDRIPRWLGGNG